MRRLVIFAALVLFTGCEAQATPFAAAAPTDVEDADGGEPPTAPPPLRYGIDAATLPYVREIDELRTYGLVETIDDMSQAPAGYDIVAGYGLREGWQQSPVTVQVSLLIDTSLPPLDNPPIAAAVLASVAPQPVAEAAGFTGVMPGEHQSDPPTQVRTQLANLGYPDGISLTLSGEDSPGLAALMTAFDARNIHIRRIEHGPGTNADQPPTRSHLLIFTWTRDDERQKMIDRFRSSVVVDLLTIPISYTVGGPTVRVDFTESGFPIPR